MRSGRDSLYEGLLGFPWVIEAWNFQVVLDL